MKTPKRISLLHRCLLALGAVAALSAVSPLTGAELATATITATPIAGGFQYDVTLNDTGTTTVGTFWFGWVPGDNFMPVSPTSVLSPAGWNELITTGGPSNGFAIQWVAGAAANDLAGGASLSGFSFNSSLTPSQLLGAAAGNPADLVITSFIYSGAPFSDAGFQFNPSVVNASATPEPAETGLIALGVGFLVTALRRKVANEPRASANGLHSTDTCPKQ